MAHSIRVLGLFSGIGGLERGVAAGLRDVGYASRGVGMVEGEAFGCACLAAAMRRGDMATALLWMSDIREFPAAAFAGAVDLVVAGFPCQPASAAGKRRGTDDERWLWPQVVRVVRETRAPLVFCENVRGLVTVNGGDGFGQVLGALADLGFSAEWTVLPASAVGAPHRRERVFVLGRLADARDGLVPLAGRGPEGRDGARSAGAPLADAGRADHERLHDRGGVEPVRREGAREGLQRERPLDAAGALQQTVADADGALESEERARDEPRGELEGWGRSAQPAGTRAAGRDDLADGEHAGLDGRGPAHDRSDEADAPGHDADQRGARDVEDAGRAGGGRPAEPTGEQGRRTSGDNRGAGRSVADGRRERPEGLAQAGAAAGATRRGDRELNVADADPSGAARLGGECGAGQGGPGGVRSATAGRRGFPLRWPPGPGERDQWQRIIADDPGLAPATVPDVRRVDDGVPAGLDGPGVVALAERLAEEEGLHWEPCPDIPERWHVGGIDMCCNVEGLREFVAGDDDDRSARVDRLRALGNAVVADQARAAFVGLWGRLFQ